MPLYNYKCSNCSRTKEKFISYRESFKPVYCDCIPGNEMTKQVSRPAPLIGSQRKKGELEK